MSTEENKDKGAQQQGTGAPIQLSAQELADIRGMMGKMVEKDALIEGLTAKTEELQSALEKAVAGQGQGATKKPGERKITTWYGKLRKYQGKWVLGWTGTGVYREANATGGLSEFININVKGLDKPVKLPFLSYINDCPQEMVKIKEKRKLEDTVINAGDVEKVVFDDKTGTMIGLGYSVPMDNVIQNYECVFDLDGEEVVINEQFVNR